MNLDDFLGAFSRAIESLEKAPEGKIQEEVARGRAIADLGKQAVEAYKTKVQAARVVCDGAHYSNSSASKLLVELGINSGKPKELSQEVDLDLSEEEVKLS